jgi:hypothetical protein
MEIEAQVKGENNMSNTNLENTEELTKPHQDTETIEIATYDPFSSENYKIEVKNLPKSFGYGVRVFIEKK